MMLVFVEASEGAVSEVSLEALTFARQFEQPVSAVVIGIDAAPLVDELGRYGVSEVLQAQGPAFSAYAPAAWAAAVTQAAAGATGVLAAGTPRGYEVLAHVACRLGATMAANVVQVQNRAPLVVSRQVLGGGALEEMRLDGEVAVMAVAGHVCDPEPSATPVSCKLTTLEVTVADADLASRVVRTESGAADTSGSLKSAKVVVGAGRGVGGPDGFGEVLELTELLGGSLGVSRVVTSLGWRPHHEQVGQTGSRITPDVYIPCGISGAIQHWAGCSSAKAILAINSDAEAPMVTKAHYAVIGDMHEIVPAINAEIRRRRAG